MHTHKSRTQQNAFRKQMQECTMNSGRMFSKASSSSETQTDESNRNDLDVLVFGGGAFPDNPNVRNNIDLTKCILPSRCGFNKSYIKNEAVLHCIPIADSRATVSLALINSQCSILQKYANKLPIMTINVSRLLYTIEAFVFVSSDNPAQRNDCLRNALEFYIDTDLCFNVKHSKHLPANERFSEFLHRLRSNGYYDYIFELATRLNLNVDVINHNNIRVVTRYQRIDRKLKNEISSRQTVIGVGYLTAVQQNENRWYVKITKTPIVNAVPDEIIY